MAHLSSDQIAGLSSDYDVLEGTMNLVQALYLNNAVEPFNDVRVRQALCYAVNVDDILALTADGHGTKLGSSMYPAFAKYFDDSLTDYYTYDPDKAKELLTEAGYGDGFTMTITVPGNYTPHVNTAQVMCRAAFRRGHHGQGAGSGVELLAAGCVHQPRVRVHRDRLRRFEPDGKRAAAALGVRFRQEYDRFQRQPV